jgi:Flp pilus assembly protein TadB
VLFFVGISQNTTAFNPSYKVKPIEELKFSHKNKNQRKEKSTKKSASASESTIQKTKKQKISFRKKLSILKLVLKSKHHKKDKHSTKKSAKWNGQHTAGLLSWVSVLVVVMAFFTGHFLLGVLASCSAILFLLLLFVEKGNTGTVDDVLWLFSQIINIIVIIGSIFD